MNQTKHKPHAALKKSSSVSRFALNKNGRKSKDVAYMYWFFLGPFSMHRFYIGKTATGIIYLLTGQLFFIGWVIDLFILGDMVEDYNNKKRTSA